MDVAKLGQRQLFGMKKETLLKRVRLYFEQTQHAAEVVEYLVVILFRHSICVGDFSLQPLSELICQIFLTETPNDTLRRHCVYFEDFFAPEEWQTVIQRLFTNEEEYHEFTKETCLYKQLLAKKNLETPKESEFQFDLVSIFKDANGKRHTWTLRNTKQVSSVEETAKVLEILTTLTIFQASGVRRFAEYVKFKSQKGCIDAEHEAAPAETVQEEQPEESLPQEPVAAATGKAAPKSQPRSSSSNARSTKQNAPKVAAKPDTRTPLQEEMPPTKSENPSDFAKTRPPKTNKLTTESAAALLEPDTSYMRHGKTKEQIKQAREERRRQQKVNKALKKKKK
ncbi:hypothetical protein P7E02_11515 [Enterococcus hulanensis]|uniref:hypothetical protein n=1 Tax=Enterococcus hulanensis TaxID=2559929 RepID=UPI00288F358E|nr:hypothetical protein [Enterococcus hulanensis]MDT2660500.1 hypothetical protein [Enterococcus hulanensis]